MAKKLSGRYCFEHDGDHSYCIPVELKEKFNEVLEDIAETMQMEPRDSAEEIELTEMFYDVFEEYRLNQSFSNYSFENIQEM